MKVNSIAKLTRGTEMRDRVLDLARDGMPDDEIAAVLTGEGHRSPNCAGEGSADHRAADPARRRDPGERAAQPGGPMTPARSAPPELAARLNIPVNWLYVQIRQKRLLVDRQPSGAYLFQDSPAVLDAVRSLRNHTISHLDLRICQPHQEGHQHG